MTTVAELVGRFAAGVRGIVFRRGDPPPSPRVDRQGHTAECIRLHGIRGDCYCRRSLAQFGGEILTMKKPTTLDSHDGCPGAGSAPVEVRDNDYRVAGLCSVCRRWCDIVIEI